MSDKRESIKTLLSTTVQEILRVERITNRALTPYEARLLEVGQFLRLIAPYAFPESDETPPNTSAAS